MDNYGAPNGMQNGEQLERPMSVGEWLITLIIFAIPCVGIIMMFVWAFGQGNQGRKNYARAALILTAIGIVLSVIFYSILGAAMFASLGSLGQ